MSCDTRQIVLALPQRGVHSGNFFNAGVNLIQLHPELLVLDPHLFMLEYQPRLLRLQLITQRLYTLLLNIKSSYLLRKRSFLPAAFS